MTISEIEIGATYFLYEDGKYNIINVLGEKRPAQKEGRNGHYEPASALVEYNGKELRLYRYSDAKFYEIRYLRIAKIRRSCLRAIKNIFSFLKFCVSAALILAFLFSFFLMCVRESGDYEACKYWFGEEAALRYQKK